MANRSRWTVAVAAACSILLAACGGGRTEEKAGCTHAAVPTIGPGDVDHFFPVDVGRTWTYASNDGYSQGTQTVAVGNPSTVQGEPVSVFTYTFTSGAESGSGTDEYAVRPAGVYRVSTTDAAPPAGQILPILVLPFPVQVTNPIQQVACQHLQFVEEGVTFDTNIVESVGIPAIQLAITVPAGTFTNVAQIQATIDLTMRAQGSTIKAVINVTDCYAPGVGLISEFIMTTIDGYEVGAETLYLTSYAPLTSVAAPTGTRSLAVVPNRSDPAANTSEELALRLAHRPARISR